MRAPCGTDKTPCQIFIRIAYLSHIQQRVKHIFCA
jgi:hypothetical protein